MSKIEQIITEIENILIIVSFSLYPHQKLS